MISNKYNDDWKTIFEDEVLRLAAWQDTRDRWKLCASIELGDDKKSELTYSIDRVPAPQEPWLLLYWFLKAQHFAAILSTGFLFGSARKWQLHTTGTELLATRRVTDSDAVTIKLHYLNEVWVTTAYLEYGGDRQLVLPIGYEQGHVKEFESRKKVAELEWYSYAAAIAGRLSLAAITKPGPLLKAYCQHLETGEEGEVATQNIATLILALPHVSTSHWIQFAKDKSDPNLPAGAR